MAGSRSTQLTQTGAGVQPVPELLPTPPPLSENNECKSVGSLPGEKTLHPAQAPDTIRMSSSLGEKVREQKPEPEEQRSFVQSDQRVYMSQTLAVQAYAPQGGPHYTSSTSRTSPEPATNSGQHCSLSHITEQESTAERLHFMPEAVKLVLDRLRVCSSSGASAQHLPQDNLGLST